MTDLSAEEIDEMREERGIKKTNFSFSCGASPSAWSNGVRRGHLSERFKRNGVKVIEYYDEHGILPLPNELDLEPLGVLSKD